MTLAEALSQFKFEVGRTYGCVVNGNRVTIQVTSGTGYQLAKEFDESDVMLDPWCDLPTLGKQVQVQVVPGKMPIEIPYIPQDDE